MTDQQKPMVKLERDSQEWTQEWNDLNVLLQQWRLDPSNATLIEQIIRSLTRLGILVSSK